MSIRFIRAAIGVLVVLLLVSCGQSSNPAGGTDASPEATASAAGSTVTAGPTGVTPTFVPTPPPATVTSEELPTSTTIIEPPTPTTDVLTPTPLVLPPTVTLAPPTSTAEPPTATITPDPPTATLPAATSTSIPPTPVPGTPTSMPGERLAGKIFYLAADGATINTVRSDGSGAEFVIEIEKQPEENVVALVGEPSGRFLLYALQAETELWPRYFLVERGQATSIFAFSSTPRWSPDGTYFVAQIPEQSGAPGPIYLYDTASHKGTTLPVSGKPDWFPDGKRLVYVADDIFVYDIAGNVENRLTNLSDEGQEAWGVQEAHVLPDSEHIAFYAGQRKNVGASGNGMQWWTIPVAGGDFESVTDPGGNSIGGFEFSPQRDSVAYSEGAHSSACVSIQSVFVTNSAFEPGIAFNLPVPDDIQVTETGSYLIRGFSWSPDNNYIAYAVEPYRCVEGENGVVYDQARIFLWNVHAGNGTEPIVPQTVIDGKFPVWIK